MTSTLVEGDLNDDTPIVLRRPRSLADRGFRGVLLASSTVILVVITAIALFLIRHSWLALRKSGLSFLVSDHWFPQSIPPRDGMLGLLLGSVEIAFIAALIAVPVALSAALVINEYSPLRLRRLLTSLVDLLAALPSLIYGIWGVVYLSVYVHGLTIWLSHHASFFPPFRVTNNQYGNSIFLCGIVVSLMMIPIVASVSREIMSQTPNEQKEGAFALGGTRWGMMTSVVFPFSRNGIVGAILLGYGRAISETIAVVLILSQNNHLNLHILSPGGGSIAANIAGNFTDTSKYGQSALTLAGLALFAVTLALTLGARIFISRSGRNQ